MRVTTQTRATEGDVSFDTSQFSKLVNEFGTNAFEHLLWDFGSPSCEQKIRRLTQLLSHRGQLDPSVAFHVPVEQRSEMLRLSNAAANNDEKKCWAALSLGVGFVSSVPACMPMILGAMNSDKPWSIISTDPAFSKAIAESTPNAVVTALALMFLFLSSDIGSISASVQRWKNSIHSEGKWTSNKTRAFAVNWATVLGVYATWNMASVSAHAAGSSAGPVMQFFASRFNTAQPSADDIEKISYLMRIGSFSGNVILGLESNIKAILRSMANSRAVFGYGGLRGAAAWDIALYFACFVTVAFTSCSGYLKDAGYKPGDDFGQLLLAVFKNFGNISIFAIQLQSLVRQLPDLCKEQTYQNSKLNPCMLIIFILSVVFATVLTMAFSGYGLLSPVHNGTSPGHNSTRGEQFGPLQSGHNATTGPGLPALAGYNETAYVLLTLFSTLPVLCKMIYEAMQKVSGRCGTLSGCENRAQFANLGSRRDRAPLLGGESNA